MMMDWHGFPAPKKDLAYRAVPPRTQPRQSVGCFCWAQRGDYDRFGTVDTYMMQEAPFDARRRREVKILRD